MAASLGGGGLHHLYAPRFIEWGIPFALIVSCAVLGDDIPGRSLPVRALVLLGDASYSLYLMHVFIITLPRLAFGHVLADHLPRGLYATMLVALACIVSVLIYIFVERPMTTALKGGLAFFQRRSSVESATTVS